MLALAMPSGADSGTMINLRVRTCKSMTGEMSSSKLWNVKVLAFKTHKLNYLVTLRLQNSLGLELFTWGNIVYRKMLN